MPSEQDRENAAAALIQDSWRKHFARRADELWNETLAEVASKQAQEQSRSHNPPGAPAQRWQRGAFYVQQLAGRGRSASPPGGAAGSASCDEQSAQDAAETPDGPVAGGPSLVPRTKANESLPAVQEKSLRLIERWAGRSTPGDGGQDGKVMDQGYWLELVDKHHRYGSNLKHYHAEWSSSDTSQNFFYWLDHGDGKKVDLPSCSREQLDAECVTYLNASQRRNYIVDVDEKGRLLYRRNKEMVDTSPYRWTDLGEGRGIGPLSEKEAQDARDAARRNSKDSSSSSSSSDWSAYSSAGDSEEEKEAAAHYSTNTSKARGPLKLISQAGWTDKLMRKTIKSNTWIYVCNQNLELYVGIKTPGKFQHSSFLNGGRVLSAGLIQVQNGVLRSLSPLSGHYRTGPEQFRAFVHALSQAGVDLSQCKFSKSLVALGLMEKYAALRKDTQALHTNIHANARENAENIKDGIKNLFVGSSRTSSSQQ